MEDEVGQPGSKGKGHRSEGKEHSGYWMLDTRCWIHQASSIQYRVSRFVLCFMILICVSNLSAADLVEPSETVEKAYRLSPPGEDPRMSHLVAGERMFRSREFTEARKAFGKVLEIDSQDAQAHYFLGLIEYEEGNVEKAKTRFQIAHDCLGSSQVLPQLPIDDKQVQLEFPDGYGARVYYKDGWYVSTKDAATIHKAVHSLEAGSTYRIELRSEHRESWVSRGMIGLIVAITFLLAR